MLSPEEVVAFILLCIVLAFWLVFSLFKIRKLLLHKIRSLMSMNVNQSTSKAISANGGKELPSNSKLQFIELNANSSLTEANLNRKKIVSRIKGGYVVQFFIDLVFLLIYYIMADILSMIYFADESVPNGEYDWYFIEKDWDITDKTIFLEVWLPIIVVTAVWGIVRFLLTINQFLAYKNKFYSTTKPIWNLISYLFTSKWQNLLFSILISMGIGTVLVILFHFDSLEEHKRQISIFYLVFFVAILLIHFVLSYRMKIKGRHKTNLKLLILRVFGQKVISQNIFTGLARFWKLFGIYFTVVDSAVYEIDWGKKYNSNLLIYVVIIICFFAAIGTFFEISLFGIGWGIYMFFGIFGIPAIIYFYNFHNIKRDAIQNEENLKKRLTNLQRWPTKLDYSFKEVPILCYNDTWKMAVDRLSNVCNAILIDLRGFSETNKRM